MIFDRVLKCFPRSCVVLLLFCCCGRDYQSPDQEIEAFEALKGYVGRTQVAILERQHNGIDVTIDRVREMESGLALTCNEMFGPYRIIEIHEADCIPSVAQVKLLVLLDNLPARAAAFCTANSDLDDMEKRFQRRFKYTSVKGATSEEICRSSVRWDDALGRSTELELRSRKRLP